MSTYPENQDGYPLLADKETLYRYTAEMLNIAQSSIKPRAYNFASRDTETVYLFYGEQILDIVDRRVLGTIHAITGRRCPTCESYLRDNTFEFVIFFTIAVFALLTGLLIFA